jgi:hypothetical protein
MASKAKPKGKAKGRKPAGKRWLIVLAFTAFWAAVNEPGQLSMGPALVLVIRALPRPKPDEADET